VKVLGGASFRHWQPHDAGSGPHDSPRDQLRWRVINGVELQVRRPSDRATLAAKPTLAGWRHARDGGVVVPALAKLLRQVALHVIGNARFERVKCRRKAQGNELRHIRLREVLVTPV